MEQLRTIKSFVKRARQLGSNKQKIVAEMLPKYCLNPAMNLISLKNIFGLDARLTLEIGFGNGGTIFSLAQKYPKENFIGVEVYQPGVASLLALLKQHPLNNIKIYSEDAWLVLKQAIPDTTLDTVLILFPDPWPKKRHHKRRLIQLHFVELLQKKLKPQGRLNIATDCQDYAKHIINVFKSYPAFVSVDQTPSPEIMPKRVPTKFEERGEKQGRNIFDLFFVLNPK